MELKFGGVLTKEEFLLAVQTRYPFNIEETSNENRALASTRSRRLHTNCYRSMAGFTQSGLFFDRFFAEPIWHSPHGNRFQNTFRPHQVLGAE